MWAPLFPVHSRSITDSGVGFQLLSFIPISINSRYQRAYDGLLKQADNDYLTNIQIQESWIFAWYGIVYRTTIMATAYPHVKEPSIVKVPAVEAPLYRHLILRSLKLIANCNVAWMRMTEKSTLQEVTHMNFYVGFTFVNPGVLCPFSFFCYPIATYLGHWMISSDESPLLWNM
jgi:uncharacterized membrane protein YeiB